MNTILIVEDNLDVYVEELQETLEDEGFKRTVPTPCRKA